MIPAHELAEGQCREVDNNDGGGSDVEQGSEFALGFFLGVMAASGENVGDSEKN